MAAWPELAEVKAVLDVTQDDFDDTIQRALDAAIANVKATVGIWDDLVDVPNENQAQAALRMAELLFLRPEAQPGVLLRDPTFERLMFGQHRRFAIA